MNAKSVTIFEPNWHSIPFRINRRLKMDQLIRFRCECGKKLKATRDIIGKKVRCTNCVRTHLVPESDYLPPKKSQPGSKSTASTNPEVDQPSKKNTSTEQTATVEPKRQNLPVPQPTQTTDPKPNKIPLSKSKVSKPALDIAPSKSSLIIPDVMAAKEPSLLPTNDDSGSRFKLDPKFDPEPSDSPLNPTSNLEFDFDAPDVETEQAMPPPRLPAPQQPNFKHSTGKTKLVLVIAAATVGLLLLITTVFFLSGDSDYPQEFSEQPEVRNYVNKVEEFRKSQRTLKIVSEAYVKSKSPTTEEREQIEAFNRSIEPLADQQLKLDEALELFKASEYEQARSALIVATQTLSEKIPELESKAKDFASKLH